MTNLITLTIPNDDDNALFHFGKSLVDMSATLNGTRYVILEQDEYDTLVRLRAATETLQQAAPRMMQEARFDGEELQGKRKEPEIDTTAQQVESLVERVDTMLEVAEQPFQGEVPPTTDSTGTPWDERIHSASKALNADGTWRLRRKPKDMDEAEWAALVESVKNELHTQTPVMTDEEIKTLESVSIDPAHDKGDETTTFAVEPPVTPPGKAFYTPENYVHMYRAADNVYALAKSDVELTEFEADGYVRHTQEQYDAWEGPNTADEGDDHHTDAGVVTEQTVVGIPPLPVPPPVVVAPPVTEWDFPRLMTFLTERHGKIDVATVNTLLAQDGMSSVQELNAHPDKIGPFVARVKAHLGE